MSNGLRDRGSPSDVEAGKDQDEIAGILLVDDRPENLVALEAILSPLGQRLVRAGSGAEALRHLLTEEFALILLDVQMPGMDGFETASLIKERERSREIPIIFVTALGRDERYVFRGYAVGAVDYLFKPIDPEILQSKVSVFVDLWRKERRLRRQAELLRQSELREAQRRLDERERELERRRLTELAESEARLSQFKATLDATLDGVLMFEPETLRCVYANQGALKQLGYNEAEMLLLGPADLIAEADLPRFRWMVAELREGKAASHVLETSYRRRDGQTLPVEVFWQFIPSPDGSGRFVSTVRDITERKQAQAALAVLYEKEKRIATVLQNSLLLAPPEDKFPGLSLATFYEPALDEALLGGDFFDAFAMEGGKVALVLGDVTGKGLEAAARTAEVKYALRAFLRETPHPAEALDRLNSVLCHTQQFDEDVTGSFICMTVVVLDPATGEVEFTPAGTEPPLVIRHGKARTIKAAGLPLGIAADCRYEAQPLRLTPEDTLLLTTDGITEARCGSELFGYEGLMRQAETAAAQGSLTQMGQEILSEARRFAGGKLQDDACLLLVRRR